MAAHSGRAPGEVAYLAHGRRSRARGQDAVLLPGTSGPGTLRAPNPRPVVRPAGDGATAPGQPGFWTAEERAAYFKSRKLVDESGEQALQIFLEDMVAATPLLSPWQFARDPEGMVYFLNSQTSESTPRYPLEMSMRELAAVFRICQDLPDATQESCRLWLACKWEANVAFACGKWTLCETNDGAKCYWHEESGTTLRSHPACVVLPAEYLRNRPAEDGESTAKGRQVDAFPLVPPWTYEERHDYLQTCVGSGEAAVLKLLEDALSESSLPAPWVMCRDSGDRPFWKHVHEQRDSQKHPLESTLRELAGVCQVCLSLEPPYRQSSLARLQETWEKAAKVELGKWCQITDQYGCVAYRSSETQEVMKEHPYEKELPAYYLKIKVLERLCIWRVDWAYMPDSKAAARSAPALPAVADRAPELEDRPQSAASFWGLSTPKGSVLAPWWAGAPLRSVDPARTPSEGERRAYGTGFQAGCELLDLRLEARRPASRAGGAHKGGIRLKMLPDAYEEGEEGTMRLPGLAGSAF